MRKVAILGAGYVGRAIAIDLCQDFEVTSIDVNEEKLSELVKSYPIKIITTSLKAKKNLLEAIQGSELVIGALPGFMGFQILKNVIEAGYNVVDISFFSEDPFQLHELALKMNVTAVIDCGIAPGMSNIILGYYNKRFKVLSYECLVGGLPIARHFPFQYKAPFSPIDVIEEYTRPARLIENGKLVVKPALSDHEYIDFENIGTLEAFNTDGIRTLIKTIKIPNMKEKTLRYLGHIDYIKVLKESGFFSKEPVSVRGVQVRPIDLTSQLLFSKWKLGKEEEEFTVMRIIINAIDNDKQKKITYNLFDKFDTKLKISSMARTTGYTASAVAHLLLNSRFNKKGIIPPELIGECDECFKFILNYQKERNINYVYEEGEIAKEDLNSG